MRRNPRRPEAALNRILLTVLIALGIALVDLSIVWAQAPAVATPPQILPHAGDGSVASPHCNFVRETSSARTTPANSPCDHSLHVLTNCLAADCRSRASLMAISRHNAAVSQFSGRGEPDSFRPPDPQARIAPLSALSPSPAMTATPLFLRNLPRSPARVTGADRSIPRPPPA